MIQGDWEDCSDEDNEEGEESQNEVEAALQELIQMAGECDLGPTMCVPCARPEDSMPSNKVVVSESAIDVPSAVETTAPTIVLPDIKLSHKLRARLLNVCGSVAYLAGDATGAVACLRASLLEDPSLVDSKIKLGSLLIDMDESTEASRLLKEAQKSDPDNAVVVLHLGELLINKNEFERAVKHLRKVQRLVPFYQSNRSAKGVSERDRMQRVSVEDIQANATALLGISLFRLNPTRPDVKLNFIFLIHC
jgi:tetratricopeptide (TPR) repeat protein